MEGGLRNARRKYLPQQRKRIRRRISRFPACFWKNSIKIGESRTKISPAIEIGNRFFALRMLFSRNRKEKPSRPVDTAKAINWLGWPDYQHFFVLEFFYTREKIGNHETGVDSLVLRNAPARIHHEEGFFHASFSKKLMTLLDLQNANAADQSRETIDFSGQEIDNLDLVCFNPEYFGIPLIWFPPYSIS